MESAGCGWLGVLTRPAPQLLSPLQDGGSLDQVLKEAKRIPEDILGKVSIAVSSPAAAAPTAAFPKETKQVRS